HLTLTEQRAVSAGGHAKRRIESQSASRQVVERAVHTGDLRAIEHVETFDQEFELHGFSQAEPARESRVDIPDVRLLEEVAGNEREAGRTAGTVDTAARSLIGSESKRLRIDAAADVAVKALTRERVQDRSKCPTVEDVLGR